MTVYRGWRVERVNKARQIGGNYKGRGRFISGWLTHYPDCGSKWFDTLDEMRDYIDRYEGFSGHETIVDQIWQAEFAQ